MFVLNRSLETLPPTDYLIVFLETLIREVWDPLTASLRRNTFYFPWNGLCVSTARSLTAPSKRRTEPEDGFSHSHPRVYEVPSEQIIKTPSLKISAAEARKSKSKPILASLTGVRKREGFDSGSKMKPHESGLK